MSKEYVRLSIEEVMNIASNHMEEDAVHAQVVLDFAADIEKEVASRCRAQGGNTSDNITQAAANKAAEEGGLPALPKANMFVGQNLYSAKQMRDYAQTSIAADRAFRQVANKAEVEQDIDRFWNKAIEAEAEANRLRQENTDLRAALKEISKMPTKCVAIADAALSAHI